MSIAEIAIAVATGLVAGAYAGLLGVGGGIIMVPSMVILLGADQQVAQGTSLVVIIVTAIAGTAANARRGGVRGILPGVLALGGMAGAAMGSVLAIRVLDPDVLRRVFGVFMLIVAARMALRGRGQTHDDAT